MRLKPSGAVSASAIMACHHSRLSGDNRASIHFRKFERALILAPLIRESGFDCLYTLARGQRLTCSAASLAREAIHVTRPGISFGVLPASLEPAALFESHQDGIKRSRFEPDMLRHVIAVAPIGKAIQQVVENQKRLRRKTNMIRRHEISLHM